MMRRKNLAFLGSGGVRALTLAGSGETIRPATVAATEDSDKVGEEPELKLGTRDICECKD